ncbi:MAG TPA: hypothetical protein P5320_02515 [Bacteroidales bacterium]|nr:hypothetical protein [Bacteroidales bacterium]
MIRTRNLFYAGLILTASALFTGCEPENYPPVAKLEVSPLVGEAPMNVRAKLDGEDPNGKKDIRWYDLYLGGKLIRKNSPIDTNLVLTKSGITKIYGAVTDRKGETSKTKDYYLETIGEPFVDEEANVIEFNGQAAISYTATLGIVKEADLSVEKNGVEILTRKIQNTNIIGTDYEEIFTYSNGLFTKGEYKFKLKSGNLEKEIIATIPNYNPTIPNIPKLNIFQQLDTIIALPKISDLNPEDNPKYINIVSLNENILLKQLPNDSLKVISRWDDLGEYKIELEFGSNEGGISKRTILGEVLEGKFPINPFLSTNINGNEWDLLETRAQRDAYVQEKLNEDWTSEIPPRIIEPIWDCTEYARQLTINFHGFPGLEKYSGDNLDSIYFYHGTFKDNGKYGLPVYGIYILPFTPGHSMNAILTGDNAENFSDWNFIEAQRDRINVQPGQVYMPENCEIIIWFKYVEENEVQGKFLTSIPILKFKIVDGNPTLIWKNDDSDLNFKTQR